MSDSVSMSAARERLLNAADSLFRERGYERVGINEIIATADIAKATFYQHFKSKEALCDEWLRRLTEVSIRSSNQLLEDPRPVRERLEARYEALRTWLKEDNFPGCPYCVTACMTDLGSELRKPVEEARRSAREFWRTLAAQHEQKQKKAKNLGDAWFLLYTGAITEARNVHSLWPLKKALAASIALGGWQ